VYVYMAHQWCTTPWETGLSSKDPHGTAKHRKIAGTLATRIRRGTYRGKIPGERALADEFGVNFKTANRAVSVLVDEGLLERRRGEGTFVVNGRPALRTRLALAFYKFGPLRPDPLYGELFASANAAAKQQGCLLELSMPATSSGPAGEGEMAERRARFIDEILAGEPEGILFCGNPDERVLSELEAAAPLVQVVAFGRSGESFVRRDPADGAERAVRALHAAGRRRIAWVSYDHDNLEIEEKTAGCRRALGELGVEWRREIFVRYPAKRELADELVRDDGDGGGGAADAVVCAESTIGPAVLAGLAERGVKVPGEVALWSFDNGVASQYTVPPMSGIRVFDGELGAQAVRTLVGVIEGRVAMPVRETLRAVLHERESTGAMSSEGAEAVPAL